MDESGVLGGEDEHELFGVWRGRCGRAKGMTGVYTRALVGWVDLDWPASRGGRVERGQRSARSCLDVVGEERRAWWCCSGCVVQG